MSNDMMHVYGIMFTWQVTCVARPIIFIFVN